MELSKPVCGSHDDRLETCATWKHLISYQVCRHDSLLGGMHLAKLQHRIHVFYQGYWCHWHILVVMCKTFCINLQWYFIEKFILSNFTLLQLERFYSINMSFCLTFKLLIMPTVGGLCTLQHFINHRAGNERRNFHKDGRMCSAGWHHVQLPWWWTTLLMFVEFHFPASQQGWHLVGYCFSMRAALSSNQWWWKSETYFVTNTRHCF